MAGINIEAGQIYKHHSGRHYQVLIVTNEHGEDERFPTTIVYKDENGRYWSRPLVEFADPEKFTLVCKF